VSELAIIIAVIAAFGAFGGVIAVAGMIFNNGRNTGYYKKSIEALTEDVKELKDWRNRCTGEKTTEL
jgi:hypothetical protein